MNLLSHWLHYNKLVQHKKNIFKTEIVHYLSMRTLGALSEFDAIRLFRILLQSIQSDIKQLCRFIHEI